MHLRSLLLVSFAVVIPAGANATGFGPPLITPPSPEVPLGPVDIDGPPQSPPPVAAPPFDLTLPSPGGALGLDLIAVEHGGPPDPLPPQGTPAGPPDLVGVVELPDGAVDHVVDHAPPFGGDLPPQAHSSVAPIPEPSSALLVLAGLTGLALRRRP
jgi:hypothetical protein